MKYTYEMRENIHIKQLKHLKHILATYVYNHCNICNIQMKHLETITETHLKQNMAPPVAIAYLVGNCDSQQATHGCSGEGEWWLDVVKNAMPERSLWTTLRRLEELGG